jgi:hypothetical protein
MWSRPDWPSEIPPEGTLKGDHEFEWLLCLASTFQTCQRQQQTQEDGAYRKPLLVAAAVKARAFWPRRGLALRKRR